MKTPQRSAPRTLVPLLLLLACACGRERAAHERGAEQSPGGPASTARPEAEDPPQPARASGPLVFAPQEGWVVEEPASAMRVAQYRLPAVEGDEQDAELVVYFFEGGAGGFDANVQRWAGQFELPGGGSPLEHMRESSREVEGMGVRQVELEGTYVAETFPGSGDARHEEGYALRAAMIEGPRGPYYVKLVGPQPTVEHWDASFRAFLGAARPSTPH